MKPGDKVEYTYTHHLNSKSRVQITKTGTVKRIVRKRGLSVYDWDANPKVVVLFEGNKTLSTLFLSQLKQVQ